MARQRGTAEKKLFMAGRRQESHTAESHSGAELCDCEPCGDFVSGLPCFKSHVGTQNTWSTSGRDFLPVHKVISTGEKIFMLNRCEPALSQPRAVLHPRRCTQAQPAEGSDCGKAFVDPSHLQTDRRMHSGNELGELSGCGMDFLHASSLAVLMQRPSTEKPYRCKDCGKGFRCSAYLNIRMGAHSGGNPMKVRSVGLSFQHLLNCLNV